MVAVYNTVQVYKVEIKSNPDDISYSGRALPYHSDFAAWCESPPGLYILHCLA